jgi:hypothetical protein
MGCDFKSAHRATPEAIPDPGRVCRNRHCCRYQKWSKGQGRSARPHYCPAPNECSSALDSQLQRGRSGTERSQRVPNRRREEVGSSYSPSLNNRIDWERETGEWKHRGRFVAEPRQFVTSCFDPRQTSGKLSGLKRRLFDLRCCVGRLVLVDEKGDERRRSERDCAQQRHQKIRSEKRSHAGKLHDECGARANHGCDP